MKKTVGQSMGTKNANKGTAPPLPVPRPGVNYNELLARYLVHSCAYYRCAVSLVSDAVFDIEARELARCWIYVTHPHKRLVDIRALRSGTGFKIDFPLRVENAALEQLKQQRKVPRWAK